MHTHTYKLGFIGLGKMGLAIARGAARSEYVSRFEICAFDPKSDSEHICKTEGFTLMNSEQEVARNCDVVILAVTPQIVDNILEKLSSEEINCVMSIVAGVSIEHLQSYLPNTAIIRGMPNTPLQINEGATTLCHSKNCPADEYDFVFKLFNNMGVTRSIEEKQMDEIITVHGSTPAYFYYFLQCLLEDAKARGIDEDTARSLLVQTMIGSGKLLQQDRFKPIEQSIDEVCSKGGSTIEAINYLKENDLKEMLHKASDACIKRAKELGK